ncbi:MAG: hypothetical protein ACTHOB_18490 [Ginsengibacter sp.]
MAYSKCPKCENGFFEVSENSPSKSNFKLMFVQCSKCGTVVGTMDYWNIGTLLKDLEKKVGFDSSSSTVNNNLDIINSNIAKLFQLLQSTNRKLSEIEEKINRDK